jgi:tetratricopeptide (TPR) repeat protein
MTTAEECKILGNKSVGAKEWESALSAYLKGIGLLQPTDLSLRVILKSNISLVLLQLSRFEEALLYASKCIDIDPKFEKGYLRSAAALEALNLKLDDATLIDTCPVMKIYRKGLEVNPNSTLLADAMKISFPLVSASIQKSKTSSKTKSSKASKKNLSGIARAEREACVSLDIRGATGQHELRVNGRYDPTDELAGGWPMYRKRIEMIPGEDDEVDEDDNLILEFHSGLDEWMIKHVSSKGSHRSFVFLKCSPPTRPELCRYATQIIKLQDKKIFCSQSS